MPLDGLIVVHHHRVQTQDDDFGCGEAKPPDEEFPQEFTEEVDHWQRKSFEEPFHGMGGEQMLRATFDNSSMCRITFQSIEVADVATCPIEDEDKDLLEDLNDRKSLATLVQPPEELVQKWIDADIAEVSHEEIQPCTARPVSESGVTSILVMVCGFLVSVVNCISISHLLGAGG